MRSNVIPTLLIGLSICLILFVVHHAPFGRYIEEEYGLPLLYKLRGVRSTPDQVLIINIDQPPPVDTGLPNDFADWPRSVYAHLVAKLAQYNVQAIAFDIGFMEEKDPIKDGAFAESIRGAGNVVLIEKLWRGDLHSPEVKDVMVAGHELEILQPPYKLAAEAAAVLAPFPLPKTGRKLNRCWLFKDSAGGVPTLPVAAYQVMALEKKQNLYAFLNSLHPASVAALPPDISRELSSPDLLSTMIYLRSVLLKQGVKSLVSDHLDQVPAGELSDRDHQRLSTLLDIYSGEHTRITNFYGPSSTILTVSLWDLMSAESRDPLFVEIVAGKTVFIGAVRNDWMSQKDGFHTVYTSGKGLELSGVEIAATVYANLLDNSFIRQPSPAMLFLLFICWSVICSVFLALLSPLVSGLLIVTLSLAMLGGATVGFSHHWWIPVIVLCIIQPTLLVLSSLIYRHLTVHREKANISKALGMYLPTEVVDELTNDLQYIGKGDKMLYGNCLMTDIENYTTLSETLDPAELSELLKAYYDVVFSAVKKRGGLVCNMVGDSMLAIWHSPEPDYLLREQSCLAALDIHRAVAAFNNAHPGKELPTRVGLHSGYLLMGNIGAQDHFEYAPIGDIVNTSSRIEGLNKQLGTRTLASEDVVTGVTTVQHRKIGTFLLGGKRKPITVYELAQNMAINDALGQLFSNYYPQALMFFEQGDWQQALQMLDRCLAIDESDGPSRFLKELTQLYLKNPIIDDEWQGLIRVKK